MKKTILIDMDDTSADFCGHPIFEGKLVNDSNCTAMYDEFFFLNLKPIDGALVAIRKLIRMGYDVQIATQPVAESGFSYREKMQWIGMWLPELVNKVNMVQDKGMLRGDYLIDDRADKWESKFKGKFVHFKYHAPWKDTGYPYMNRIEWENIVKFFEEELKNDQSKTLPVSGS